MRIGIILFFTLNWALTSFSQNTCFSLSRDIRVPISRVDSVFVNGKIQPEYTDSRSSFISISNLTYGNTVTFYCENVFIGQFFVKETTLDTVKVAVFCTVPSFALEISDLTAIEDIKNNKLYLYTPNPQLVRNEKIINDILGSDIDFSLRLKGGHSFMELEGIMRYNTYVLSILDLEEPILDKLRRYLLFTN